MANSCALIGEGPLLVACASVLLEQGMTIQGVISDSPEVESWCRERGVPRAGTATDPNQFFGAPMDYLFSIVNHRILPRELLERPRRLAINYHDSLLPEYSGFNATAWAILDGEGVHGITWHAMSEAVDAGAILVQERFEIADDDTAYTLTAKCADAGLHAFRRLLSELEAGNLGQAPALDARGFHFRSQRPSVGWLDPASSAAAISGMVRGLDFGPDENWMCVAKLLTPAGKFIGVTGARQQAFGEAASAGTVLSVDGDGFSMATGSGTVQLWGLLLLDGTRVQASDMARLGLVVGAQMPKAPPDLARMGELDQHLTRCERFWVRRLEEFSPTEMSELARASGEFEPSSMALDTSKIGSVSGDEKRALLLAALALYMKRVSDVSGPVQCARLVTDLKDSEPLLYADWTPLHLSFELSEPLSSVLRSAKEELARQASKRTYARDVWCRYPSLRRAQKPDISVAVSWGPSPGRDPRFAICLDLDTETLLYDRAALSEANAVLLVRRLAHLVQRLVEEPDTNVLGVELMPEDERKLLTEDWQQTQHDGYLDQCVHRFFEQQAERTPDQVALIFRDESITYRELNLRSNAVALQLAARGVGPDVLVGVYLARSIEMLVALLGVLKAGGAYVPLDPAYPAERISFMIEDARVGVLITNQKLSESLPAVAPFLLTESFGAGAEQGPTTSVATHHLAYVIFTSGSTGRPKGVMVEHRNVANFIAGMDALLGTEAGVWLAVTSISFDISVLELFWTLGRGYKIVLQEEGDAASLRKQARAPARNRMGFGLFYFAADSTDAPNREAYRLLLEGARFADQHDFVAVWTPERHFHAFGGLYPNAAVTSAALAVATEKIEIRAGSVVLPLHDPIRVAEDWAVVDNLSGGRVGLSFASGWHANDFALKPENFQRRREIMYESIDTVLRLWRGEPICTTNGDGKQVELHILPRPIREQPPMWVASAGSVETFKQAGLRGYNILTNMLGQDLASLKEKFKAYREARAEAGHAGPGTISVMLHTFVCADDEQARSVAKEPFCTYLQSSYDLVKMAPFMFPAFKAPSQGSGAHAFDATAFDEADMKALLDHAFERYFDTAGLFGTKERALRLIDQLSDIGVNEVACLVDFGIDADLVLENLVHLDGLRRLANDEARTVDLQGSEEELSSVTISEQLRRHGVTHLQCTPSMARVLLTDGTIEELGRLKHLLLGGEALPEDLVRKLAPHIRGQITNMYGPTETTIWSTVSPVRANERITIGRPIVNTIIRILDPRGKICPVGVVGELCIGGRGVVRGYLGRADLTQERFVPDPLDASARIYRTGDLARYLANGEIEYVGRADQQVKVNGYRMELGEIESVMAKHPAVREAVVAVKTQGDRQRLIGYFVPRAVGGDSVADVKRWGQLWNEAYERKIGLDSESPRFDFSGWLSSFTGAPLTRDEMSEWLDETLAVIRGLGPARVLELGCGTGMVLFGCLASVEHYAAIDLSSHALDSIFAELTAAEQRKVSLKRKAAHDLKDFATGSFDLVVINSVAQYFPSAGYLADVLEAATRVIRPGGHIFVGDVRHFGLLPLFHTMVEVLQAPGTTDCASLREKVAERARSESELLLDPAYFSEWATRHPEMTLRRVSMKKSAARNEMNLFRYDVVLEKKEKSPPLDMSVLPTLSGPKDCSEIRDGLLALPERLFVCDVVDARLAPWTAIAEKINAGDTSVTAAHLRDEIARDPIGIDPSDLDALHDAYDVMMRPSSPGRFEALFSKKGLVDERVWAVTPKEATYNQPMQKTNGEQMVASLRQHMAAFLPAYMIPSAYVPMDAFPLTPNGKIDRKALIVPETDTMRTAAVEYVRPENELEEVIVKIWRDLLGLERIGTRDNIFDLGASSLLTVEANNLLQAQLGRKIPLVNMFRFPTIELLARHLGESLPQDRPGADVGAPEGQETSDKQKRLQAAAERRRRARLRLES